MSDKQKAYFQKMYPYAKRASDKTTIPVSVILSQWAWETGYGSSELSLKANNHAGIKVPSVRKSLRSGTYNIGKIVYSKYASLNAFADDYVLNMQAGYYDNVRKATSVEATLKALGASPWAEYPYKGKDGIAGNGLLEMINRFGLKTYDASGPSGSTGSGTVQLPKVEDLDQAQLAKIGAVVLGALAVALSIKK